MRAFERQLDRRSDWACGYPAPGPSPSARLLAPSRSPGTLPAMNRILALYNSKTGNTVKMAPLVREGAATISDTEHQANKIAECGLPSQE